MGTIAIISAVLAVLLFVGCAIADSWDWDLIAGITGCLGVVAALLAIVMGMCFHDYKSDANRTVSNASQSLHQQGYDVQRIYATDGVWYAQVSLQQHPGCKGTITFVPNNGEPADYTFTATIVNGLACANAAPANSALGSSDSSNANGVS